LSCSMSNEWTHGHFACCNDGFVPCLCQQGECVVCAMGRAMDLLEGGNGDKFILWSAISWLCCPVAEFMIRRKVVEKYDIRESAVMSLICCWCNPVSHYTMLMEVETKQGGKFGFFGGWEGPGAGDMKA